jgi:hypothetical protein
MPPLLSGEAPSSFAPCTCQTPMTHRCHWRHHACETPPSASSRSNLSTAIATLFSAFVWGACVRVRVCVCVCVRGHGAATRRQHTRHSRQQDQLRSKQREEKDSKTAGRRDSYLVGALVAVALTLLAPRHASALPPKGLLS